MLRGVDIFGDSWNEQVILVGIKILQKNSNNSRKGNGRKTEGLNDFFGVCDHLAEIALFVRCRKPWKDIRTLHIHGEVAKAFGSKVVPYGTIWYDMVRFVTLWYHRVP